MPYGNIMQLEEVPRWLRVGFDRKTNFKQHVKTRATYALRAFTAISSFASTNKTAVVRGRCAEMSKRIDTLTHKCIPEIPTKGFECQNKLRNVNRFLHGT